MLTIPRFTPLLAAISALVYASAAFADARLNATLYGEAFATRVISVEPLDDSTENLQFEREFVAQLEREGFQVTDNAPSILYFWMEDYLGGPAGGPSRKILQFGGTKGSAGQDDARVQLNLYSSQGGGLLNNDPGTAGEERQNPNQVRVGARVRTRSSNERVWEAEALGDIEGIDRDGLIRRLIPPIVRSVGTSVKNQNIDVK